MRECDTFRNSCAKGRIAVLLWAIGLLGVFALAVVGFGIRSAVVDATHGQQIKNIERTFATVDRKLDKIVDQLEVQR